MAFEFGIYDGTFELEGSLESLGGGKYRFEKSMTLGHPLNGPRARVSFDGRVIMDAAMPALAIGEHKMGFGLGRELDGVWITVRIAQIAKQFHGILVEAEPSHLTTR